jgi:hypothetical protein
MFTPSLTLYGKSPGDTAVWTCEVAQRHTGFFLAIRFSPEHTCIGECCIRLDPDSYFYPFFAVPAGIATVIQICSELTPYR